LGEHQHGVPFLPRTRHECDFLCRRFVEFCDGSGFGFLRLLGGDEAVLSMRSMMYNWRERARLGLLMGL
jgi:hypothetical protein